ncbi:MAG TPA: hypothetical protein VHZ31_07840 [Solirubrobacteraceae bacterium]|nr:hypothetical protein [Solirubrobacteraceae bacterium]
MFVATHAEWRCQRASLAGCGDLSQRAQVSSGRRLTVQVVAAERVDMCARDRGDARHRGLVGDDVGLGGVEVVDRGGHVAGVPDLDGVDEDLQAQGVAAAVVFVGGDLGA